MQNQFSPTRNSPPTNRLWSRARRGEVESKTVIIIILCVAGGGIAMMACCLVGPALLLPAVQASREAARRAQSRNNLHNLGIALHNYHDVYSTFPPGGVHAEDGTGHLGWQASLLPYVDQAPLYNSMDTDRPWTDSQNIENYSVVIEVYQHPSFAGDPFDARGLAVSSYAGNSRVLGPNSSTSLADIRDGAVNTVLVGEVAAGFKPWGDPTNIRDPAAGLGISPDTFGGPASQEGAFFVFADGMVKLIADDIDPAVLEAIATPDGGEMVPSF